VSEQAAADIANLAECLRVRRLGTVPYVPAWHAMQRFTQERDTHTLDEIWLLEHPPVFTQGQAGKAEHILAPGDIPVVQVDRGGQVTYHGPGQLMVYLLVDVVRKKIGVRDLITAIESALVEALAGWGIAGSPRPDAPGVYVQGRKIASLGLRIRRGRSFHGLALNVSMDMAPFNCINPCGYAGMTMAQVEDFVPNIGVADAAEQVLAALNRQLRYREVEFTDAIPDCWAD
jgi:lipoyl(octanoyl) transferase